MKTRIVGRNQAPRGARAKIIGLVCAVALAALEATSLRAQIPAMPLSPVTISIVDVAGNLALTQEAIEAYRVKHPI